MLVRSLVFRALLTGIVAVGRPAPIVGQQSIDLPLHETRAIVVVDAWRGYSAITPTRAVYRLVRAEDGSFTGTVRIRVGAGRVRRDASFAVQLSRAAADSLLQVLSEAPVQAGRYRPAIAHTDDYPSITVRLTVGGSAVRFHTRSQGAAHVPWQVIARGRSYVTASEAIWPTLAAVLDRIGGRQARALMEAAENDFQARHGPDRHTAGSPPMPGRRRFTLRGGRSCSPSCGS